MAFEKKLFSRFKKVMRHRRNENVFLNCSGYKVQHVTNCKNSFFSVFFFERFFFRSVIFAIRAELFVQSAFAQLMVAVERREEAVAIVDALQDWGVLTAIFQF